VGAALIGLTSYVPNYLQGTIGVAPIVAGLALAALTIGWPISAAFAGRFYLRIGFRSTSLIGIAVVLVGAIGLTLFVSTPSVVIVAVACFIIGLGMGLVAVPSLIAAQSSVPWNERGVVTGTNMFARSIGSAVGVAIFGAIANAIFGAGDAASLSPSTIEAGTGAVFLAVLVVVIATVAAAIAMPRTTVEFGTNVGAAPEATAA
jgi:MFS family permease